MIQSEKELKESYDFINKDLELYDFDISDKLSSLEYNLYYQDIEYFLDVLYEKIRALEDILDYTDQYVDKKILKIQKDIESKISVMEKAIDTYTDKSSINILPKWNEIEKVYDRDGAIIFHAEIKNSIICSSGITTNKIFVNGAAVISNEYCYFNNIKDIKNNNLYISCYSQPSIAKTGITEELILKFNKNTFNNFEATPVNCQLEIIEKTDEYIKLKLSCDKYQKKLKSFDYKNYNGSNLNSLSISNISFDNSKTIYENKDLIYKQEYAQDIIKYYKSILDAQKNNAELKKKSDNILGVQV